MLSTILAIKSHRLKLAQDCRAIIKVLVTDRSIYFQKCHGFDSELLSKYEHVSNINHSITSAVKFIKNGLSMPTLEAVKLAVEGVYSLEFHKNLNFIKVLIEICANHLPLMTHKESVVRSVESVVLSLLAHNNIDVKKCMYQLCRTRVLATVGPKYNANSIGNVSSQIQFLLRSEILLEILNHGVLSEDKFIGECAEDIVIHLLKCKILVPSELWNTFVEALIPNICLLVCHANKRTGLGRTIVNILDPDVGLKMGIPNDEVSTYFLFIIMKII